MSKDNVELTKIRQKLSDKRKTCLHVCLVPSIDACSNCVSYAHKDRYEIVPIRQDSKGTEDNWKHRSKGMRCKACMYFVGKPIMDLVEAVDDSAKEIGVMLEAGRRLGRCRKHAPTLNGWPAVFSDDWCGDHKLDENKI